MWIKELKNLLSKLETNPNYEEEDMIFLNFNYQKISSEEAKTISTAFKCYKNIITIKLELFGSSLSNDDNNLILESFLEYNKIVDIDLNIGANSFNSKGIEILSKIIKNNAKTLSHIQIQAQFSKFNAESLIQFGSSLPSCKSLIGLKFEMSKCEEGQNGILPFLEEIITTHSLKQLTLNFCGLKLGDSLIPAMIRTVQSLKNLEKIGFELSSTDITEEGLNKYVDEVILTQNLKQVMLVTKGNNFEEKKVTNRLRGKHFSLYKTAFDIDDLKKADNDKNQQRKECPCILF